MINTRLMYIKQNIEGLNLAVAIEQVEELLGLALYMEKLNNLISLYGKPNSDELLVGKEVVGREENLYSHDLVNIEDFSAENVIEQNLSYKDFKDLVSQAKREALKLNREYFRIQIDLDDFSVAHVYFFDNLEKYIGPACA